MRPAVILGDELKLYSFGPGHPFNSKRVDAFREGLESAGLMKRVDIHPPRLAVKEELRLFHTDEYIGFVERMSKEGDGYLDGGDTPAFDGVFEAASYTVGATLKGLELLMKKKARRAFNPVGGLHHARRGRAGGFCVFNDIGVAIGHARREHGLRRILYVDIDVHHGDGVYYEFESDPDVWTGDIHQMGIYPGTGTPEETGKGKAKGTKLNIPMYPGDGDERFSTEFERVCAHARKAEPELIIFQCGADGMEGDALGGLEYHHAHRLAAERLCAVADDFAEGRILGLGGGGYTMKNVAAAWSEVVGAFCGKPKSISSPPDSPP